MTGRPFTAVGDGASELEAQLSSFFAAHYDRLVRLASLVCHAQGSVEDAVQAAMEQAWRHRHTLHEPSHLRQWLDRIVVREAIRANRRPWWARLAGGLHHEDEAAERGPSDGRGDVGPAWIALVAAYRRLPAEQRAVIALHLYEGYSVEETATLTGASLETTRSRLRLGRNRLRRELGEDPR